jgi:H+/Cl- antiporter ClcA/CBS domain-containing protein
MNDLAHPVEDRASLPVAPSMSPTLAQVRGPRRTPALGKRVVLVSGLAVVLAVAAALVAQGLTALIALITNAAYIGRLSAVLVSPAKHTLGVWAVGVPVLGALVVGVMARFGASAIRGHGIPEAMDRVLFHDSRIPMRITFLKPLSAAIAIGTGGPFGAEGPIIATGGALGSLVGQVLRVSADERKALLAAGAAAGMAGTFGSPVSAVLLAIELLLFEYRARSFVPVALAAATATAVRAMFVGSAAVFAMPPVSPPSAPALIAYVAIGAVLGLAAVAVTKAVYAVEDTFERLPIHWMWWPAIGGVAIGVVGLVAPRTLGVGYDNIEQLVTGDLAGRAVAVLCFWKLISWAIALGSGTSGGTLAPLFTIGGGLGATLGAAIVAFAPGLGLDVRIAALVGMAALFAGASHALLASVLFAFETTRQSAAILPLLGACTASYLVSSLSMRNSIMTEKLARRGVRIRAEYDVDHLAQEIVRDHALKEVVTLAASKSLGDVRAWIASHEAGSDHQGFPVIDERGDLLGVVTRRDLLDPGAAEGAPIRAILRRPAAVAFDDSSLREVADHMIDEGVGRLPVVTRARPRTVVGIVTRGDLLNAHKRRLDRSRYSRRK